MAKWRPNPAEAQFLGELLNVDSGLAGIARDLLAKGSSLESVVYAFKTASAIAALGRAPQESGE